MIQNKKVAKDFRKYLAGGIIWTILTVPLTWFLIDYIGMYAFFASVLVVISGIIIRFYMYTMMKLIKKEFLRFAWTEALFSILNVALMTLTIDIMKLPTLPSVCSIILGLFLLKFLRYIQMRIIAP